MSTRRHQPRNLHPFGLFFAFASWCSLLVVPLYALRLGYPVVAIGILGSMPAVSELLLRPLIGSLSDTYGEARMLQAGALSAVLGAIALALSGVLGVGGLVATQLLFGLGRGFVFTIGKVYATKMAGESGRNISLFTTALNIGKLSGLGAGGYLIATLGYEWTTWVVIGLSLIPLSISLLLPEPPEATPRTERAPLRYQLVPRDLPVRSLTLAGLCAFTGGAPNALVGSFYPTWLAGSGYSEEVVGMLVMLVNVGVVLAGIWGHSRLDRVADVTRLTMIAMIVTGAGILLFPAIRHIVLTGAVLLVTGFAAGQCNLTYQMLVRKHSPTHRRGAAMAYVGFFFSGSVLVLPAIMGAIAERLTMAAAFAAAGVLIAVVFASIIAFNARTLTTGSPVTEASAPATQK